jgi:hypothetical protein
VVAAVRSSDLGTRVSWDHADTGREEKMHDFWLLGDGVREALEITTLMEQDSMTNLKHWQKVGPGLRHHDLRSITGSPEIWLGLPAGTSVEVLRWPDGPSWRYAQVALQR